MDKKILIVTTISGFVPQFEMNNVKILQSMGYEVHYAANYKTPVYGKDNHRLDGTGIIQHQIDFVRTPFSIKNIVAYKQLKRLVKEETYQLVHCHTPMAGVITRLLAKSNKIKCVVYTTHGFHFYKGAPFINWIVYYPIERWLAKYTDTLITINREDYERAKKFKVRNRGNVEKIPGPGIDITHLQQNNFSRAEKRNELQIKRDAFVLVSIGELNGNKNQQIVIKALAQMKRKDIVYLICGDGKNFKKIEKLIKNLNMQKYVKLLGYQKDIRKILITADCFILSSKREGISIATLEAMAFGLPVIASDNRGTREYMEQNKTGYIYKINDITTLKKSIEYLYMNKEKRIKMGEYNKNIVKNYQTDKVEKKMLQIYTSLLGYGRDIRNE